MQHFRFDQYRLDIARRELWRGQERLDLSAKAFDCIAYLVEHRDRAVGRDELIAVVWARSSGSNNLLDQVIRRARCSLGDTDSERRMIRTVPRFGYAWIAVADVIDAQSYDQTQELPALGSAHEVEKIAARSRSAILPMPASSGRDGRDVPFGFAIAAIVVLLIASVWLWSVNA